MVLVIDGYLSGLAKTTIYPKYKPIFCLDEKLLKGFFIEPKKWVDQVGLRIRPNIREKQNDIFAIKHIYVIHAFDFVWVFWNRTDTNL